MSVNRNNVIGGFEDSIEKGQSTLTKSVKNNINDSAKSVKGQLLGASDSSQKATADQGTNEVGSAATDPNQSQMTDEERKEFLSNLYGKNDNSPKNTGGDGKKPQKGAGSVKQALGIPQNDPNKGKTPEEIAKIEALRKQLHSDYYQDLLNKSKTKEEPVAEKLEREEEEQKMAELDEKKKKPSELPKTVKQGTAESTVGVAG